MKLHTDDEITIGSGNGTAKKFRIAESAKAFKILSSNLYKHKIRAVIRELSCNACDAHVLSGHTRDFNVTLPTMLDPRFIIRDFGPGLSDQDVMELYTTYFASTKSDSNDYIGALGLGSKSPFSYTETFSVVSNYEGVSRGYTAYLDNGEPNIVPTFVEATTDESGIEITVPVKEPDISKFHDEARYLYRAFNNIRPNVFNARHEVEYFPDDEMFEDSNSKYGNWEETGFYAIMGNIVYPIQREVATNSYLRTRGARIYFRFPLGALDITPSREELSLDEQTIENIETRVNACDKVAAEELTAELLEIKNRRRLVLKYAGYSSAVRRWINVNVSHPEAPNGMDSLYQQINKSHIRNKHPIYEICEAPKMIRANINSYYGASPTSLTGISVGHVTVLIDDKPSKRVEFVRGLASTGYHKSKYIIVIDPEEPSHIEDLKSIRHAFDGQLTEFVCSDNPRMYKAASAKTPGEARPKYSNVQKVTFTKGNWFSEDMFLTSGEVKELSGYAIHRHRDEFFSLKTNTVYEFNTIKSLAREFGINQIYVLRSAALKHFADSDLKCVLDPLEAKFVEYIDLVDYDEYGFTTGDTFLNRARHNRLKEIEDKLAEVKVSPYYDMLSRLATLFWGTTNSEGAAKAKHIFNILQAQQNLNFKDAVKRFKEKYPMIYYVVYNCYTLAPEIIEDIKKNLK